MIRYNQNIKSLNITTNLKSEVNILNYKLNEIKCIKEFELKEFKVQGLLNTAASKKIELFKDSNTFETKINVIFLMT